jgi:hypothetical protein
MPRTHFALRTRLILTVALVTACASGGNRLEGPNYASDVPPFVAAGLETLTPAPGLPDAGGSLVWRVLLIGDAGDSRENQPTLDALGRWGNAQRDRTTVLFLGDNLYPEGLHDGDRERGEAVLRSQLDATGATRIFTPGNHDWGIPSFSAARLMEEQRFIDAQPGAELLPKEGCPGPATRVLAPAGELRKGLAVVLLDLQWWLLPPEERPECGGLDEDAAVAQLGAALRELDDHWVIVGAHHPLTTGGPHGGLSYGGFFDLIIGMYGWFMGGLQNTYEPAYANAIMKVSPALATTQPLLFAGGHDHNLQLLRGGPASRYEVVSGAGSVKKVSTVTHIEQTLFAHAHPGFIAIDFHQRAGGDEVLLHVVETGSEIPVLTTQLIEP